MHSLRQCAQLLLALSILGCSAAPPSPPDATATANRSGGSERVQGEVLVGLEKGREETLTAIRDRLGMHIVSRPGNDVFLLRLPPGLGVEQAIEELSRLPGVRYAEPNYLRTAPPKDHP